MSGKKLLLHACCAPCSSSVLERLNEYDVTAYFYNPNIRPLEEYQRRLSEMSLLNVRVIEGERDEIVFKNPFCEGGARCSECFYLRLRKTAEFAKENGYVIFSTTLTVSPHKNAEIINEIGEQISKEICIEYLPSDWKKRGGFQRSLELSKQLGLYRQNYCGCTPRADV